MFALAECGQHPGQPSILGVHFGSCFLQQSTLLPTDYIFLLFLKLWKVLVSERDKSGLICMRKPLYLEGI